MHSPVINHLNGLFAFNFYKHHDTNRITKRKKITVFERKQNKQSASLITVVDDL
jgi:hypothetical protein